MTDNAVTDGDLRNARLWAEKVGPPYTSPNYIGTPSEIYNVARVVLATVEAPDPTLADEIRCLPDFTMSGENCINDCHDRADTLATRAEQMERDAEDQREWNRRITEQVATLARERDEARAEVEGINFEKEVREAINDHYDRYAAQERAESPNPADVKPGEAWLVECRGERRTAVKDRDDNNEPWNTFKADGWYLCEDNEDVTLITRLVPAPRVITNPNELDRLPLRAVILSTDGQADVYQKDSNGEWVDVVSYGYTSRQVISMENAVTVLWEPEV